MAHIPERVCVVCRKTKPRTELLRLVRPTGRNDIVPDPTGRTSGKGVYLCRSRKCVDALQKERRLRKLFAGRIAPETLSWIEGQVPLDGAPVGSAE